MNDDDFGTDIPSARDVASAYSGKYAGVADLDGQKLRGKITGAKMVDMKQEDGTTKRKVAIQVSCLDKFICLNATNYNELRDSYGAEPRDWLNQTIGIYADKNVMFAGKKVAGLRIRALPAVDPPKPKSTEIERTPGKSEREMMDDDIPF